MDEMDIRKIKEELCRLRDLHDDGFCRTRCPLSNVRNGKNQACCSITNQHKIDAIYLNRNLPRTVECLANLNMKICNRLR